ncbi:unnamed protein product [Caenorhabditis auriculariae]|uniref:Domain of unknown function DX domain-containing protein n=1 Tax=Caenorhabditis auriculariae TaxID=2777116 RepID=A0A8S1HMR0_9PELO|nr:unnamed protein product [Caenorhabditis auriculariae]
MSSKVSFVKRKEKKCSKDCPAGESPSEACQLGNSTVCSTPGEVCYQMNTSAICCIPYRCKSGMIAGRNDSKNAQILHILAPPKGCPTLERMENSSSGNICCPAPTSFFLHKSNISAELKLPSGYLKGLPSPEKCLRNKDCGSKTFCDAAYNENFPEDRKLSFFCYDYIDPAALDHNWGVEPCNEHQDCANFCFTTPNSTVSALESPQISQNRTVDFKGFCVETPKCPFGTFGMSQNGTEKHHCQKDDDCKVENDPDGFKVSRCVSVNYENVFGNTSFKICCSGHAECSTKMLGKAANGTKCGNGTYLEDTPSAGKLCCPIPYWYVDFDAKKTPVGFNKTSVKPQNLEHCTTHDDCKVEEFCDVVANIYEENRGLDNSNDGKPLMFCFEGTNLTKFVRKASFGFKLCNVLQDCKSETEWCDESGQNAKNLRGYPETGNKVTFCQIAVCSGKIPTRGFLVNSGFCSSKEDCATAGPMKNDTDTTIYRPRCQMISTDVHMCCYEPRICSTGSHAGAKEKKTAFCPELSYKEIIGKIQLLLSYSSCLHPGGHWLLATNVADWISDESSPIRDYCDAAYNVFKKDKGGLDESGPYGQPKKFCYKLPVANGNIALRKVTGIELCNESSDCLIEGNFCTKPNATGGYFRDTISGRKTGVCASANCTLAGKPVLTLLAGWDSCKWHSECEKYGPPADPSKKPYWIANCKDVQLNLKTFGSFCCYTQEVCPNGMFAGQPLYGSGKAECIAGSELTHFAEVEGCCPIPRSFTLRETDKNVLPAGYRENTFKRCDINADCDKNQFCDATYNIFVSSNRGLDSSGPEGVPTLFCYNLPQIPGIIHREETRVGLVLCDVNKECHPEGYCFKPEQGKLADFKNPWTQKAGLCAEAVCPWPASLPQASPTGEDVECESGSDCHNSGPLKGIHDYIKHYFFKRCETLKGTSIWPSVRLCCFEELPDDICRLANGSRFRPNLTENGSALHNCYDELSLLRRDFEPEKPKEGLHTMGWMFYAFMGTVSCFVFCTFCTVFSLFSYFHDPSTHRKHYVRRRKSMESFRRGSK